MTTFTKSVAACCLAALLCFVGCGSRDSEPASTSPSGEAGIRLPDEIKPGLWIVDPTENAKVDYRPYVVGTVSDTSLMDVVVVVHAIGGEGYWVQPRVAMREDGVWLCQPHIGLEDTPSGSSFEVRAFAGLENPVVPGADLPGWPRAKMTSNLLTLVRE